MGISTAATDGVPFAVSGVSDISGIAMAGGFSGAGVAGMGGSSFCNIFVNRSGAFSRIASKNPFRSVDSFTKSPIRLVLDVS